MLFVDQLVLSIGVQRNYSLSIPWGGLYLGRPGWYGEQLEFSIIRSLQLPLGQQESKSL